MHKTTRTVALPDGNEVSVVELGEGAPLVFLHGSGPGASGWNNFRENARVLAAAGYRCVMPDLIGFGHSSKPTDIIFTLEYHARAVEAVIAELGLDRVTLVGNSLGGAIAIQCALDHPELVSRLVLMAPGWLDEREAFAAMEGIQAMRKVLLDNEGLKLVNLEQTFALMFADPTKLPHALVAERFELAKLQNATVYTNSTGHNLSSRLVELTQPVLGFWGAKDRFCPFSGAMTLAMGVANCHVVLSSRCGHWFMMEERDLFNAEVLRFLRP